MLIAGQVWEMQIKRQSQHNRLFATKISCPMLKARGLSRSFLQMQGYLFAPPLLYNIHHRTFRFQASSIPHLNHRESPFRERHRECDMNMCPTKQKHRSSGGRASKSGEPTTTRITNAMEWKSEAIHGGSLRHVDLHTGTNGWASPPGDLFSLRSKQYLTKRIKSPAGEYLLSPVGMDWLKSTAKLDNVLARPDNRVFHALRKAQALGKSLKSFILAVNLQVPGKDHHSAVFYFAAEEPIPAGSLLYRFVNGDDTFRNQRFKIVNRIVKGPWIVKKAVGNYSACLLGKALTCNYHRGPNYLEIDVDIGSSAIASAILHLALGYVTSVTIDMGFVVEAQAEEELPERLLGAVRVCQMEMSSATVVDAPHAPAMARGSSLAKVNHRQSGDYDDDGEKGNI